MDNLKLRKELKKRKPTFRRQDAHKKDRVSRTGYRRPKGIQSKVRLNKRGYVKKANPGYGSPADVKGMDKSGLKPFLIYNVAQLDNIDPKEEGVILSSNVGERKRIQIIEKSFEKDITLLNVKDPKKYIEELKSYLENKKKQRQDNKARKAEEEKKKEAKKTKSEADDSKPEKQEDKPEDDNEKQSDEKSGSQDSDKKDKEKQEKDKVLTKKE